MTEDEMVGWQQPEQQPDTHLIGMSMQRTKGVVWKIICISNGQKFSKSDKKYESIDRVRKDMYYQLNE